MATQPASPNLLAHAREGVPRKTLLRWVSVTLPRLSRRTVTCLLCISFVLGLVVGGPFFWTILALALSGPALLFAATESPTSLDASAESRSGLRAVLTSPWSPGGGRGVTFLALHMAATALAFAVLFGAEHPLKSLQMMVTCAFATLYVLLPCAFAPKLLTSVSGRLALRCTSAVLVAGGFLLQGFSGSGPHDSGREFFVQLASPWALGNMITYEGRFVGHPAVPWVLSVLVVVTTIWTWRVKSMLERRAGASSA